MKRACKLGELLLALAVCVVFPRYFRKGLTAGAIQ
jgi:hypothetical protein